MWLPETIMALAGRNFLPKPVNDLRIYFFIPWAISLFTMSIKEINGTTTLRSAAVAFLAFLPPTILAFVFIR